MKKAISIVGVALLILVVAGVTLAYASSERANTASETSPEIEGTWLATITFPDGTTIPSLLTYARGGALTVTDSSVPPALGNVYQGAWTKTGPHEFAFTFLGFQYDETGALIGFIRAHENIQLDPGEDVYTGETIIEILDVDMNVIMTDSSTSYATRIAAK
jgi:hypothetical protein